MSTDSQTAPPGVSRGRLEEFTQSLDGDADFGPGRVLTDRLLGIDCRRTLPTFAAEPFDTWVADREPMPAAWTHGEVILFPDCYTTYNHPEVGRAAVQVLEACGWAVRVPDVECCGRAALSQGLVETAQEYGATNVDRLHGDEPVLSVEPSCTSASEDYRDLLDDPGSLPDRSTTVAEFLYREHVIGDRELPGPDECGGRVAFHGHCHSTARSRDHAPVALLRAVRYEVEPIDATCCGMAGAFGYETEHYDLSMELAADLEEKLDVTAAGIVAVSGASCSQQLDDRDVETAHPIELLAEVVA